MLFSLLQRNPEISHILNNPDLMRQVNCIKINLQWNNFNNLLSISYVINFKEAYLSCFIKRKFSRQYFRHGHVFKFSYNNQDLW